MYKLVPELKEAKDVFEAAKADPVKRKMMQAREDVIKNYASDLATARDEKAAEIVKKCLSMFLVVSYTDVTTKELKNTKTP